VKRYVEEPGSGTVRRLLASGAAATSRLSEVEVASALARRCREGTLVRRERDRALAALRADIAALWVIELLPEVAQASVALLDRYPLRTGDGVQLASCLYLKVQMAEEVSLLAYDARLNEAARAAGVPLLGLTRVTFLPAERSSS
jgi:predicted nucleic acid-binding protein